MTRTRITALVLAALALPLGGAHVGSAWKICETWDDSVALAKSLIDSGLTYWDMVKDVEDAGCPDAAKAVDFALCVTNANPFTKILCILDLPPVAPGGLAHIDLMFEQSPCSPRSDVSVVTTVRTAVGTFYIDDRPLGTGPGGVRLPGAAQGGGDWIYMESNNIPGLQRGGASEIVPGDVDDCQSDAGPDTLVA
jgi:hypothetical protein